MRLPFLDSFVVCVCLSFVALPAAAQVGGRVSLSTAGNQGTLGTGFGPETGNPAISGDGRFIAFSSPMPGLVPGDTNNRADIFVRDRRLGTTTRISIPPGGDQADHDSDQSAISADGRYIAFASWARLLDGDTEASKDVFLFDQQTRELRRVSVGAGGAAPDSFSGGASISGDGRLVAFNSNATNLLAVPLGDPYSRVYVRDTSTGVNELISVSNTGTPANGESWFDEPASITRDGRLVVFASRGLNLTANDTNNETDVFVRDRTAGTTTLVSAAMDGAPGNGRSSRPSVSADGRFVLFVSHASNLVPDDTNGALDVFLRDLQTGTTERVSLTASGGQSAQGAGTPPPPNIPVLSVASPRMSADSRFIVFEASASDFVPSDFNAVQDLFIRDRVLGTTRRVSVTALGWEANAESAAGGAAISADGRWIAFSSRASNLVPGDTNFSSDIFLAQNAIGPAAIWTAAADGGSSRLRTFDLSGHLVHDVEALPAGSGSEMEIALGDINADGRLEVVAAADGGPPLVRVLDALSPTSELAAGFVFEPTFTGGVSVAVGDTNGNGRDDVVVGRKRGGTATVRVFTLTPAGHPAVLSDFVAYPGPTTGVRVAVGDLDGDGRAEIVTSPGPGANGPVKLFTGTGLELGSGFPFAPASGSVHLAIGDIDGDRRGDIIVGGGAGMGPRVRVFHLPPSGGVSLSLDVDAYGSAFQGGVRVGAGDLDGDGRADLVVAPGHGAPALVRVTRSTPALSERFNFVAFPSGVVGGAFVAAPRY